MDPDPARFGWPVEPDPDPAWEGEPGAGGQPTGCSGEAGRGAAQEGADRPPGLQQPRLYLCGLAAFEDTSQG
jgi:hypothetical protein